MTYWTTPHLIDLGSAGLSRAKTPNSVSESRTRHYVGGMQVYSFIKHYANKTLTGPS